MMKKAVAKKAIKKAIEPAAAKGAVIIDKMWERSWTYIKTVVDVVHEPILILSKDLRVMAANEPFYRMFQVDMKDTEGKLVYELGNDQWDIPSLRKLLEDILPKNTFFRGFEVAHEFPFIGRKVMILNARQIYFKEEPNSPAFPPTILLAMEDITEMIAATEQFSGHIKVFETDVLERIKKIEKTIEDGLKKNTVMS
jgi:hypothetical protein